MFSIPKAVASAELRIREAGWTIDEFCDEAGIHRATWQRWKAGRNAPMLASWSKVERLTEALSRKSAE